MKRKLPFIDPFSSCKKQKINDTDKINNTNDNNFDHTWINKQNSSTNWKLRWTFRYQYLKYHLNNYLENNDDMHVIMLQSP